MSADPPHATPSLIALETFSRASHSASQYGNVSTTRIPKSPRIISENQVDSAVRIS
jgi:hypothetical protein